jgi:trimeric autotransporter adhesin
MPSPVSVTCSIISAPERPVLMVTWPPAGVNFSALVSRFVISWCSQCGSASTGLGASRRSSVRPAASKRRARLSAAVAASSARSQRCRARFSAAASAAASVCRSPTIRASRRTSSRSELSSAVVGSATPSSSASWPACRMAMGVRSSWATSATRLRRICSCRSRAPAIWSKAAASSRSSAGARISPTRAARSPAAMARVTAMSRVTGRVIRRATASPVTRASSAARPAAPAMARSSAASRTRSAALSPEPVDRTSAVPTRWWPTTIGRLDPGPVAALKSDEATTTRPPRSRIRTAVPVLVASSRTGERSSADQVSLFRSHAAPAATAIALASSERCLAARAETSAAANAAVSPASRATAASATPTKASASRRPSAPPRPSRPGVAAAGSVITGQAEPVAAAEHGLHDLRITRIVLDLAAQVLHV